MPSQDTRSAPSGATLMLAYLRDEGEDTTTCACGNKAVCVGQFEGEPSPMVACDECCNHEDFAECGRCWPLPQPEAADDDGGQS